MASYTFQRIGKSLVKYFKPIRVAKPHLPGQSLSDAQSGSTGENLAGENRAKFKLLKFKKPAQDKFAESRAKVNAAEETALEAIEQVQLPEKAPAQWLELVVGLLGACKRVTQKVRKKMGIQTYAAIIANRSKAKFQTLGSIVNTTSVNIGEDDVRKAG